MALEYISKNQTVSTNELKNFLQEKNISPINILAVLEGLIEVGHLFPNLK